MVDTKTTELLFHLIPLLDKKFVSPVAHQLEPSLSRRQVDILFLANKKKSTMTELSQTMLISKQQLTPLINKLVLEGFVQREYDPIDRRIIKISTTATGCNMLEQVRKETLKILEKNLNTLDSQDLACLNQALTNLDIIIHKLP